MKFSDLPEYQAPDAEAADAPAGFQSLLLTLVVAGAVIAAAILLGAVMESGSKQQAELAPTPVVSARPVQMQSSYVEEHRYLGVIEALDRSALGFEIAGKVVSISFDEGEQVRRGQVIARIDTSVLAALRKELEASKRSAEAVLAELRAGPRVQAIERARADLELAQSRLDLATATLARVRDLHAADDANDQQLDDAVFAERSARAQLKLARQSLDELEAGSRIEEIDAQSARVDALAKQIASLDVRLQKAALIAPFDGRIARRLHDTGAVLDAGMPLVELVSMQALRARIGVPAGMISKLGSQQNFTLRYGMTTIMASLDQVLTESSMLARKVELLLSISDPPKDLRPGESVELILEDQHQEQGFWLELSALSSDARGLWRCLSARELPPEAQGDDQATHELIAHHLTMIATRQGKAYLRGTLPNQSLIVQDGAQRFVAGQRVKLKPVQ